MAAPLVPLWRSLADMRYLGQRPHALDNSRLVALLGSEAHTPLHAAVAAAIDDLYPWKHSVAAAGERTWTSASSISTTNIPTLR